MSITKPMKIVDFKKTVPDIENFINEIYPLTDNKISKKYVVKIFDEDENYVVFLKEGDTILCFACFNLYNKPGYLYLNIICSRKGCGKYMIYNLHNICVDFGLLGIKLESLHDSEEFYKKHGFFEDISEDCNFNRPDEIFSEKNKKFKKFTENEVTAEMVFYVMNKIHVSVFPFVNE